MTRRNQLANLVGAAAIVVLATPQLQAQSTRTVYWQGGTGILTDANYHDGTTGGLVPNTASQPALIGAGDVVNFGGGGSATLSSGSVAFQKLRVGHNEVTPGGTGAGDVTVNNGATINLVDGASGSANAGLWVGNVFTSTLNIDGAGSTVTSNRLIIIGYAASQLTRSGTVNVTNGGSLIATDGNINLGDSPSAGQNGIQGHLFVDGTVSAMGSGADLNIGVRKATSSFTQTGGTVNIADVIEVGFSTGGSSSPSFSISGGTTTHGGNFFVGRGASTGATVNISGTGVLNTGNRFLMGGGTATGGIVNHTGGTLNTTLDVRVADAGTGDSTYNLSGMGVINSTTGGIVGRQGTGIFNQTGGQANFNGTLSIGSREVAVNPTNGLYKISAGDLNVTTALNIAPKGTGALRVVGDDATIDVTGNMLVDNTVDGVGTLAFELETGDLLSMISVTGNATFNAGASLLLDATNASPTQTSYDLLTAVDIVDNGIAFTGPASWTYQIVSGGLGEILQAVAPGATEDADFDADGDVDGADFLTWQRGLGGPGGLANGDANADNDVDAGDLATWKTQFGVPAVAASASIPEPGAGVVLLIGTATAAAWRRRNRNRMRTH